MSNASTSTRACPICKADKANALPRYSRGEWAVVECTGCTMVYLQNPADYEALEEDFAWEKTFAQEDRKREKKRSWIKRAANNVRMLGYRLRGDPSIHYLKILGAGNILDIGCGDVVRWHPPLYSAWYRDIKSTAKTRRQKNARIGWEMRARRGCRSDLGLPGS